MILYDYRTFLHICCVICDVVNSKLPVLQLYVKENSFSCHSSIKKTICLGAGLIGVQLTDYCIQTANQFGYNNLSPAE